MVGNIIGVKRYYEGVGRKSGCVEFDLVSSTERVNAVLYPCGGRTAVYFFWVSSWSGVRLLVGFGGSGLGLQGRGCGFSAVMGYMTAFTAKKAKFVVHSSLALLLGELAVLSEFGGEVGLVGRAGRTDGWSSGVV